MQSKGGGSGAGSLKIILNKVACAGLKELKNKWVF